MIQNDTNIDVDIFLAVNAKQLYNIEEPQQDDILAACKISDDPKATFSEYDNVSNKVIDVYKNKDVSWSGKAVNSNGDEDPNFQITIESIVKKNVPNNFNLFSRPTLLGRSDKVKAKVNDNADVNSKVYVYEIDFSIIENGNYETGKSYTIDPKLQGHA